MKRNQLRNLKVGARIRHYMFGTSTLAAKAEDGTPLFIPDTKKGKSLLLQYQVDEKGKPVDTVQTHVMYSDLPKTFEFVQICSKCGCSDDDACVHPEHGHCWWVAENLCSHCHKYPGEAIRHSKISETV